MMGCLRGLACSAMLAAVAAAAADTPAPAPLPDTDTVVKRIVERAGKVAEDESEYVYTRRATTEEIDDKGRPRSKKQKVYIVTQVGGVTRSRLVSMTGKDGKMIDVAEQSKKEEAAKERLTESGNKGRRGKYEQVITTELFRRFQWTVEGRAAVEGRTLLVLGFRPLAEPIKADKMADRVINQLSGKIWVDETIWEVARVEASLQERVTLWGGLLGALDNFRFVMKREPGAGHVWFVKEMDVSIMGRRLFSAVHFRARELSEDFRRALSTTGE